MFRKLLCMLGFHSRQPVTGSFYKIKYHKCIHCGNIKLKW
jgi:formate hydrogenlyase subunit 6/NADH:ubiquinone oxidoreductase subunit I